MNSGLINDYVELARVQFLNGDAPEIYRANLSKATRHIIKSFKMAYDKNDPDYIGDKNETDFSGFGYGCVDWFSVGEGVFIEGFHCALMASDFNQARELARLLRDRPDGRKLDKEINRYARALKCVALGEKDKKSFETKLSNFKPCFVWDFK